MECTKKKLDAHIFSDRQMYFPMWDLQKKWVEQIDERSRNPSLLMLEHEHVYTLGRSGNQEHLLVSKEKCSQQGIELAEIDRGGDITYHGPGQLVGYPLIMLDSNDTHLYLRNLEETLIQTLAVFNIQAERKPPYTGVWVENRKIAAIGVKFNRGRTSRRFITSHGFALNVNTDLHMFDYIVPCGIREYGVTSMAKELSQTCPMEDVIKTYYSVFRHEFGFHSSTLHEKTGAHK